ncbi:MAG: hypothetical protein GY838_11235 [bacterium]|nr:hypothetical protein [bacterium]
MKNIRFHLPVLALLVAVVYAAFGRILSTPLWNATDAQILCDAHVLSLDPTAMFAHGGFYFSQPLLNLVFLAEYRLFGLEPAGYIAVSLAIHAANAFVVYMLVNMLFPRQKMALLASILFAFGVGSYGRIFTSIHQLESLLLASFHLLVLYFFIRNDFRRDGRILSPLFALGLGLFLMTGLTKAASFSLVLTLMAYKVFFHGFRWRKVLSADIILFFVVAVAFHAAQSRLGYRGVTVFDEPTTFTNVTLLSVKNLFRYLNLMFFPLQSSALAEQLPFWIDWLYDARRVIRVFITMAVISYSFFGFVFGSRAIRFFIAFTYVTLLPFTAHSAGGAWLNLSHLYLTSLGFCVILAAGTVGTCNLLERRHWRRFAPYAVPLVFAVVSIIMTTWLDRRHRAIAARPEAVRMRAEMEATCLQIDQEPDRENP